MTYTDLRMLFKTETGRDAIDGVNSKNRHKWLSDKYTEWLEGKNMRLRDQFKRDRGLSAMRTDFFGDMIYRDVYKNWLEEKRLELQNVIEKLK